MSQPFDPSEYECVRAPVVDEFVYNRDGVNIAVNDTFLGKVADRMNARGATGDLCPLVVGHTKDDAPEVDQPPTVGYLTNYSVEPFRDRTALYADHYIRRENKLVLNGAPMTLTAKELVERFPRRSGEIWFSRYELDPHSLLGATAPERDLGLLRLSQSGDSAFCYTSPGEIKVADKKDETEGAKDTGGFAEIKEMLSQILAALSGAGAPQGPGAGAGSPDEDAEFAKIMQELEAQGGDQKPPVETPKEDEKAAKLQKELDEVRAKLRRSEVVTALNKLRTEDHVDVDPADEDLIADLMVQPEALRDRFLNRIKLSAKPLPGASSRLNAAVKDAKGGNGKKRLSDDFSDMEPVIKLAREKGLSFQKAAAELGYTVE